MCHQKKISFFSVIAFVNLILADNFILVSFFLRIAEQAPGVNPNPCHSFIRGTKPSENEATRHKIIKFKHITSTDMPWQSKCYYSKLPFISPSQMLIEGLWEDEKHIWKILHFQLGTCKWGRPCISRCFPLSPFRDWKSTVHPSFIDHLFGRGKWRKPLSTSVLEDLWIKVPWFQWEECHWSPQNVRGWGPKCFKNPQNLVNQMIIPNKEMSGSRWTGQ